MELRVSKHVRAGVTSGCGQSAVCFEEPSNESNFSDRLRSMMRVISVGVVVVASVLTWAGLAPVVAAVIPGVLATLYWAGKAGRSRKECVLAGFVGVVGVVVVHGWCRWTLAVAYPSIEVFSTRAVYAALLASVAMVLAWLDHGRPNANPAQSSRASSLS